MTAKIAVGLFLLPVTRLPVNQGLAQADSWD
jgi:hypothetical protein